MVRFIFMLGVGVMLSGLTSCGSSDGGSNTTSSSSTVPDSTTTTGATTTTKVPATTTTAIDPPILIDLPISPATDPPFELLFSIPVGPDGVTYEGGGEDLLLTGPGALEWDDEGSIWIADTESLRVLRYDSDGNQTLVVDTDAVEVGPIIDLAATPTGIWALEIVPALDRYQIVHFDREGELTEAHELPDGLHLDDGLSGLSSTPDQGLLIEVQGGTRLYSAFSNGGFGPTLVDGYEVSGTMFTLESSSQGVGYLQVGDVAVREPVEQFGGFEFKGSVEGAAAFLHSDVGTDSDGALTVDLSIFWYDTLGNKLAVSDYPNEELGDLYMPTDPLAVAPDGRLVGMVPRPDRVDVQLLNAFAP